MVSSIAFFSVNELSSVSARSVSVSFDDDDDDLYFIGLAGISKHLTMSSVES